MGMANWLLLNKKIPPKGGILSMVLIPKYGLQGLNEV